MESASPAKPSKAARLTGWIIPGILAAVMIFGGVMQMLKPEDFRKDVEQSGWTIELMTPVFFVVTACFILYFIPRTAVLGAILLTGYFGGAVATHVRIHDPFWFPAVIVCAIFWGCLLLREPRLRPLAPITSPPPRA